MRKKFMKSAALAAMAGFVMQFGCNFDFLAREIGTGFGRGLGALPAEIVAGYINDAIGGILP